MDGPSFKPFIQKSCVRAWLRQDSPRRGPPRGAPHRSHLGRVGTVYLKGRLGGDRGWLREVEGHSTLPSLQQRSIPSTQVWRHRRLSWGRTSSVHSFLALAARGEPMHNAHASCCGCRHTADCNKAADRIVKGAGDLDQRSVRPIEPDSDIQTAHDQ